MSNNDTQTWPTLAIGLYEQLTGRNAQINYQFDNMQVDVPSRTGENATSARWQINGGLKISTSDNAAS